MKRRRTVSMRLTKGWMAMLLLALPLTAPVGACDLGVEGAWIRVAPPGAAVMAGYGRLTNAGKATLRIKNISSDTFGSVSVHESMVHNGMAMMRPITIEIASGARMEFEPGGKHLMLMNPVRALKAGDAVELKFQDAVGCLLSVRFEVRSGI